MARKTKTIKISSENRDLGKSFLITEMSAAQAERWSSRYLSALVEANPDLAGIQSSGMSGIAALGVKTLLAISWDQAEPLLAEMLACAQIVPDPTRPSVVRPLMPEVDIEEVSTLLLLRSEVIELHTGFSVIAALSKIGTAFKTVLNTQSTPTSQLASA